MTLPQLAQDVPPRVPAAVGARRCLRRRRQGGDDSIGDANQHYRFERQRGQAVWLLLTLVCWAAFMPTVFSLAGLDWPSEAAAPLWRQRWSTSLPGRAVQLQPCDPHAAPYLSGKCVLPAT